MGLHQLPAIESDFFFRGNNYRVQTVGIVVNRNRLAQPVVRRIDFGSNEEDPRLVALFAFYNEINAHPPLRRFIYDGPCSVCAKIKFSALLIQRVSIRWAVYYPVPS